MENITQMENIVTNILRLIINEWKTSPIKEAVEAAELLEEVLETEPVDTEWDDPLGIRCEPPDLSECSGHGLTEGAKQVLTFISQAGDKISWKTPSQLVGPEVKSSFSPTLNLSDLLGGPGRFKSAMMVGSTKYGAQYTSDKLLVGLTWLAPGTIYPPHAHHAAEVYQILVGSASWGPTPTHLAVKPPGQFLYHGPALPNTIQVPEKEPLLAVYAWTGNISGRFWFGDPESGRKFENVANIVNPASFYDQMADSYEAVVRGWGYNMPEVVVDHLVTLVPTKEEGMGVLDLGCGDGLVGEALTSRGFKDVTGFDISAGMVAIAANKPGVYSKVEQVDLLGVLPRESDSVDILTCVGTSTYLNPSVFKEWVRVVKPGGLLAFTHKSGVLGDWEETQQRMEEDGVWSNVFTSQPLYYLPALRDPSEERVTVFIYRKL